MVMELVLDFTDGGVKTQALLKDLHPQVRVGDVQLAPAIRKLLVLQVVIASNVITENGLLAFAHVADGIERVIACCLSNCVHV
jgi:hypothetical protein